MEKDELREEFIRTIQRFMKTSMKQLFGEITREEFFMLEMVGKHARENEKGIYVSELAKQLNVSSPAVSRMLRYLELKKLIYRQTDAADRRNTCVFLTAEGIKAQDGTRKILETFSDKIIAGMGMEDMSALLALCNKLANAFEAELKKQ